MTVFVLSALLGLVLAGSVLLYARQTRIKADLEMRRRAIAERAEQDRNRIIKRREHALRVVNATYGRDRERMHVDTLKAREALRNDSVGLSRRLVDLGDRD